MGARINYIFSEGEDKPAVVLYSHWQADEWENYLAPALRHAKPRLDMDDTTYATRMIISHLIGADNLMSATGFGLFAIAKPSEFQAWDLTITIDMVNKQVEGHTFDAFTAYHLREMETANA